MKLDNMFKKTRIVSRIQSHNAARASRPEVPEGLLRKCNKCGAAIIAEDVKQGYYICPKCGDGLTKHESQKNKYICRYCDATMVRADIDMSQYMKLCVYDKTIAKENTKNIANKYGNNQFSEEEYCHRIYLEKEEIKNRNKKNYQQSQPSNQPKCPTCGSTNIEKISAGKKMKGSFLFGIFSSDVRNQMHCKDCGYKW